MKEPVRPKVRNRDVGGYARLCFIAGVASCCGLFAPTLFAQGVMPATVGVELSTQGGVFSDIRNTAVSQSVTGPLVSVTQAGVLATWHFGPVEATASTSLASAFASGARRGILPLGLMHVAMRQGPFTLMLGLEQSVGVPTNLRARASHDTSSGIPDSSAGPIGRDTLGGGSTGLSSGGGASGQGSSLNAAALASMPVAFVRTADAVGGIGWEHGPARLMLMAGLQTVNISANGTWVGLTANVALDDGIDLTVATRQESRNAAIQTPAFSLGLSMVRWPFSAASPPRPRTASGVPQRSRAAFTPVRVDLVDSLVQLHVLLPTAHRVVIAGDLTDWNPVVMTDEHGGWWVASLPKSAGVSRVHLRSDAGEWGPVPGLPTTTDEYGGTVSLLLLSQSRSSTTVTASRP